jgi:type IV pilus assembly protein PilN
VILINLLPHREEKRRQRKQAFMIGLGVAAVIGALVAGAWTLVLQQLTDQQRERNTFLRAEIGRLESQIKDIANLREEIESLQARQAAVEDLQLNRNVPVHLLDELVKRTPEGIYLTAIRQTDNEVQIQGVAQTNERVSEFLRNAQSDIPWVDRLELVEIKAVSMPTAAGSRETRRLFEFAMRMTIRLPESSPEDTGAGSTPRSTARKPA